MTAPKLRFGEFEGDWNTNKIDEISIVTSGGTPSRNVVEYWNGHIPWVTTSLVDFNVINKAEEFITKVGLDNSSAKLFPKDTILMAMYGQGITRGKVAILGIEATTNQACAAIKLKDSFDTKFVFQNLMNRYEEIRDLSNEGGQKNLSAGIIKEILISFPAIQEQTKIASFLSTVDEKISQLTQKHELLSQYKQGMMQNLFSQQIRFKADDGGEFGEWEDKKIIDIADYVDYRGKTPKKVDSGVLLVTAKNIRFGYIDYQVSKEYIGSKDFDEVMRRGRAAIGDVLITTEAPLGNIAMVDREDIALAQRVIKYRGKSGILNNEFLKQKFLSEDFQSLIFSKATGGTVQGIKGTTLHNLEIQIPRDIEEQTKIANFLSAIDQKIEVVAQQIQQTKLWKKGLLQQMFV